jgi:DNA-binding transcriptional regulator YdaS (Cro superfamily)
MVIRGEVGSAKAEAHSHLLEVVKTTGMTQRQIARLVGVHETTLCRYMVGRASTPPVVLSAIRGLVLQVAIQELLRTPHRARGRLVQELQALLGNHQVQKKPEPALKPPRLAKAIAAPKRRRVHHPKCYDAAKRYSPDVPQPHPHTQHLHPPSGGIRTVISSIRTGGDDD